jgi:hypothetical protein
VAEPIQVLSKLCQCFATLFKNTYVLMAWACVAEVLRATSPSAPLKKRAPRFLCMAAKKDELSYSAYKIGPTVILTERPKQKKNIAFSMYGCQIGANCPTLPAKYTNCVSRALRAVLCSSAMSTMRRCRVSRQSCRCQSPPAAARRTARAGSRRCCATRWGRDDHVPSAVWRAARWRRRPGGKCKTNAIHLLLFVMQNRMSGPYTAAMHRILISAMCWRRRPRGNCVITETHRIQRWNVA